MINILVVRFPNNQLGDMLCSVPMLAALKNNFPDSHITLIAALTNYKLDYKSFIPYIDEIVFYEKKSLIDIFNFYRNIRKRKYNIGIIPSNIKLSRTSHIINYLSGAIKRVGVNSIDGIKNKSSHLLNIKSDFNWYENKTHQIDRGLDIIRQLGINIHENIYDSLKIKFSELDLMNAKTFIDNNFPDKSKKIFGFHPGAGKLQNMWATDNFIELITKLYRKFNNYVVLTAGAIDGDIIKIIKSKLDYENIKYILLENYPVIQLGAILSKIDLYFTNDTGTMHLASYSGTEVITPFGPTNEWEWAPKAKNFTAINSPSGKINDIDVDNVFEIIKSKRCPPIL